MWCAAAAVRHAYIPRSSVVSGRVGSARHGSLTARLTLASARQQRYDTCKHQKQNGPTWGWRLARGALATWMSSRGGAARAGGAASPRGSDHPTRPPHRTPHPPPAPLSWALISPRPGYSIKACSVHRRCNDDLAGARVRCLWVLFITTSLSPLFLLGPRAGYPGQTSRSKFEFPWQRTSDEYPTHRGKRLRNMY